MNGMEAWTERSHFEWINKKTNWIDSNSKQNRPSLVPSTQSTWPSSSCYNFSFQDCRLPQRQPHSRLRWAGWWKSGGPRNEISAELRGRHHQSWRKDPLFLMLLHRGTGRSGPAWGRFRWDRSIIRCSSNHDGTRLVLFFSSFAYSFWARTQLPVHVVLTLHDLFWHFILPF